MLDILNVYRVERTDNFSWCEYYAVTVVAKDELHAERTARQSNDDFKKVQGLKVTKIDLTVEQCISKEHTGA